MNQQTKPSANLRPLGLTAVLCLFSISAALDLAYGKAIIGSFLMMAMIGVLAVIFLTCERYIFVLDAAATLVILFFAANSSLFAALFGLVLIIASMILAQTVRKKKEKVSVVLAVCFTVFIGYALVWTILYAADGNSLAPSDLLDRLNAYFDSLKAPLAEAVRRSVESLSEEVFAYYQKYDITKEMLLQSYLESMENYVDIMQMLLPGFSLFAVQVMAYIGVTSFEKTVKATHYDALLPEVRWRLYPSQPACVIYLIITSLYAILSFFSASSAFLLVVMNLWLALMPVMLACGFRSLKARLAHPRLRRSMIVILILFVIGIFFMPDVALPIGIFMLTFMGAQDVSVMRAAESAKKKSK